MKRREFLRNSLASCGSFYLVGCGGGNSNLASSPAHEPVQAAQGQALKSVPATPVPALSGISIDAAEAEIKAEMAQFTAWAAKRHSAYQSAVVVRSPDELVLAIAAAHAPASLAMNNLIICDWNGLATLSAGETARLTIGKAGSVGFFSSGGSLRIEAATGARPAFANSFIISTQGVILSGLTFARVPSQGEAATSISAVSLIKNSMYSLEPIVHFEDCRFGSPSTLGERTASESLAGEGSQNPSLWVKGLSCSGLSCFVSMMRCKFSGLRVGCHIISRSFRMDLCDFSSLTGDAIDLFGHKFSSDYYAVSWISRTTVRNAVDRWEFRNNHIDAVQTGTSADIHLGYRNLITDFISHISHSFSADPGMGGGSGGFFNDDALQADNQFVVRRCAALSTAPHGFCFFSPKASRPSFVDQCVFMRSGRTPSGFLPDANPSQDMTVGITGKAPEGEDRLLVTRTIGNNGFSGAGARLDVKIVDPRLRETGDKMPERVFVGRDFTRGGAAANFLVGKFAYDLPNEKTSQAQFVADVWANFRPKDTNSTYGIPNPTTLGWVL